MENANGILTRSALGNLQKFNDNAVDGQMVSKKKARNSRSERKRETPKPIKEEEMITSNEEIWEKMPVLSNPFCTQLSPHRKMLELDAIRLDDENDPNEVPDYAFIAFEYFRAREKAQPTVPYLQNQSEINEKMRQVLVDWLVEMQESFQLAHETLYLAVTMTDLYMSRKEVKRDEMQLIGATSILLASKFYERYPPYLDDLVFVCDEAYTRDQFLSTEMKLIQVLDFDINLPVSYLFLRRYAKVMKFTMPQLTLARYVLELSLMEYEFVTVPASKMASAAFLWSLLHFDLDWNKSLVYHTSYERKDLVEIVGQLNAIITRAPRRKLRTIYDKYSHENFFKVTHGIGEVKVDKNETTEGRPRRSASVNAVYTDLDEDAMEVSLNE